MCLINTNETGTKRSVYCIKKIVVLISAVVVLSVPVQAYALERTTIIRELLRSKKTTSTVTAEPERFKIGVGAWPTTGRLDSFVYQPVGDPWIDGNGTLRANQGDTISKLQNKLNSTMVIMDVDMYLFGFMYADASMGIGGYGGEHIDTTTGIRKRGRMLRLCHTLPLADILWYGTRTQS